MSAGYVSLEVMAKGVLPTVINGKPGNSWSLPLPGVQHLPVGTQHCFLGCSGFVHPENLEVSQLYPQPAIDAVFPRRNQNGARDDPEAEVTRPGALDDVVILHDDHIPKTAQLVKCFPGQVERLISSPAGQSLEPRKEGIDGEQRVPHVELKAVAANVIAGLNTFPDVFPETTGWARVCVEEI